ncbi:hypothetical protein RQP46_001777 [Phenoliferia psychrophenolica]
MATALPVLSYRDAKAAPHAFTAALHHALSTVGFFQLSDIQSVVPTWERDWDAAFDASQAFFALPDADKRAIRMEENRHFRGYSGVAEEVTAGKRDLREQIDLGPDSHPIVPYPPSSSHPIEKSLYGPNQYPSQIPSFAGAIQAYRATCEAISRDLVELIGASLTPTPELFTSLFDPPSEDQPCYSRMKVVRYPGVVDGIEGLGVGPHKDGGGLTLLAQDGTGGLQVQSWNGKWEDVQPIPYALVINVGQVIERMSASLYPATTHRVLPPPSSRISIPFFFCPPLATPVIPLVQDQLHPHLRETAKPPDAVSEVPKGDLHEEVFGRSAWRGVTRSHAVTWRRWYGEWDTLGGPVVVK